jgi:acyl-CoA reductase-like NAD-dependent aldehyde dehydrogenase
MAGSLSLNLQDDMIIAREEIFGPVMCLMKFR